MDYKEIMDITNNVDIDINEFNNIDVTLTEKEKVTIKKELRKTTNTRKRFKSKRAVALACSVTIFLVGSGVILSKPAFAENLDLLKGFYEKIGYHKQYKDYTEFIGETREDKGYKFTIDKLVVTENRMLMAIKVTYDQGSLDKKNINCVTEFFEKHPKSASGGIGTEKIDDNTKLYVYETNITDGTFKKKGDMSIVCRIDGEDFNDKVEIKEEQIKVDFNLKVDFTKAFESSINRKLNEKLDIGNTATYLREMKTTPLGTMVTFSQYDIDQGDFVLQVDDKIFKNQGFQFGDNGGTCYFNELTSDKIKGAKSISFIALDREGKENLLSNDDYNFKIPEIMEKPIKLSFLKGIEGEIYKVDWKKDKLRVYLDFGDRTIPEASKLSVHRENWEGEHSGVPTLIVKDKERKNGYYMERDIKEGENYFLSRLNPGYAYKIGKAITIK